MQTNVWPEPCGELLRQQLLMEGKRWNICHQPPGTLDGWLDYRAELRDSLRRLAGTFPEQTDLDVREFGDLQFDGYRIRKLTYQSRPGLRVTANLYVPDGKGPFPAILGTHGHWQQGKIAERVASRGHTFAREGFVVLIVDAFGSGERCTRHGQYEYHGGPLGASLMSVGETLLGMQVYDNMRGVDLLQSLSFVDPERIGVTGASGGGNQTMWLAAFDERIKAAVPVVSVGTFESYLCNPNCICEVLPGGLQVTEEWGILALAAPAALLILNAMRDSNRAFHVSEMMRSYQNARSIYRLLGAEEKIACQAIDLPHGYWPEMRRHALGWFKYWLKGEGNGWPCDIPDIPTVPEQDLLCFENGQRPEDVISIVDYVTAESRRLKEEFLESAASRASDADTKRGELQDILRLRDTALSVMPGRIVTAIEDGYTIERFSLDMERGALLPCMLVRPDSETQIDRIVIAAHPGGKAAAWDNPHVRRLLGEGTPVCLVDLRNLGETRWDTGAGGRTDHEAARTALWLGRTMVGEWTEDLTAVAEVFRNQEIKVELLAWDIPALAALATAALGDCVDAVTVVDLLSSYVIEGKAQTGSMAAFLPDVLLWGDVSLLVALADCPVTVHGVHKPHGEALSEKEFSEWLREVADLVKAFDTGTSIATGPAVSSPV